MKKITKKDLSQALLHSNSVIDSCNDAIEKYAKEVEGLNKLIEDRRLSYAEEIKKFKDQVDGEIKKVGTINKTATEQITSLQIKCQEFATAIRLLSRHI